MTPTLHQINNFYWFPRSWHCLRLLRHRTFLHVGAAAQTSLLGARGDYRLQHLLGQAGARGISAPGILRRRSSMLHPRRRALAGLQRGGGDPLLGREMPAPAPGRRTALAAAPWCWVRTTRGPAVANVFISTRRTEPAPSDTTHTRPSRRAAPRAHRPVLPLPAVARRGCQPVPGHPAPVTAPKERHRSCPAPAPAAARATTGSRTGWDGTAASPVRVWVCPALSQGCHSFTPPSHRTGASPHRCSRIPRSAQPFTAETWLAKMFLKNQTGAQPFHGRHRWSSARAL